MQILGNAPLPPPKKDGLEYALIIRNQTYDHKAKTASNNEPAQSNSPILKSAELTIEFIEEFEAIGLIRTKVFKSYFAAYAAQIFTGFIVDLNK